MESSKHKKCFISSCFVGSHFHKPDIPSTFPRMKGYDYFLFTNIDKKHFKTSWSIINIDFNNTCKSITQSRYPKFQGWKQLKNYDIIIYCDAYLRPIENAKVWDKIVMQTVHSKNGIVQSPHPIRKCPYMECQEIVKAKKDSVENIRKTLQLFKEHKLEKDCGLWENVCFCYYTRNVNVQTLFNKLWEIYSSEKYTHRDQPLYMLAIHLTGIKPEVVHGQGDGRQGYMRKLVKQSGKTGNHMYV